MKKREDFLPIDKGDLIKRNIHQLDFIIVTGDAYVDHPSFGTAIISRVLESQGFTVGIIAQPDWSDKKDFMKLGKPKYAFLVNSGNIDSMVNHYSVNKIRRKNDLYSPNGERGHRPDRAVIVYSNKLRECFKSEVPIIIGGIEASLRRFAHYDYWSNKIRRSILLDSKADMLLYGMGEKTVIELSNLLSYGKSIKDITDLRGTVILKNSIDSLDYSHIEVPSYEQCADDKIKYAESFKLEYYEQDAIKGKAIVQKQGDRYIIQNPPQFPLTVEEMDFVYSLPYTRTYHPIYESLGGIPAINEINFSITSHRGCFGGCSFCALTFHQGRVIQKRSEKSIIHEADLITTDEAFKGYIHDIGGPTANFRNVACKKQVTEGVCKNKQCLFPKPCKNLIIDHSEYLNILRKVRSHPKIKKVFVRSGIRYDYLIHDTNTKFFEELCEHHISGQLKVAPEHISDKVLCHMGKPGKAVYEKFRNKYIAINKKLDTKQFLVPYLMSSHPGSDINAAIELAEFVRDMGHIPEQVQDFYPTPGSLSTVMYYTGINPLTGKSLFVPKTEKDKKTQRALLQYSLPENHALVKEALLKENRYDLIGNTPKCLIKEQPSFRKKSTSKGNSSKNVGKGKRNKKTFKTN